MSLFKKKQEVDRTLYIDAPVQIKKEQSFYEDDDGVKTETKGHLDYSARTEFEGEEITSKRTRYVGDRSYYTDSESDVLDGLRNDLYNQIESKKLEKTELPLGEWVDVDWSRPKVNV